MKKILFFATLILALCVVTDVEAKKKKFKNGDAYEGEIVKGLPSGEGVMTYANGDVYNGNWSGGVQAEKGVMTYANGDKYNGSWLNGIRFGSGKMTYFNGDLYNGSWEKTRSGLGDITFKNGESYSGSWSDDKFNGRGTYTYLNKDKLNCVWEDGNPSNRGTVNYANGDKYDGGVQSMKRNGPGTFTAKYGYVCNGDWIEDEFVNGTKTITKSAEYVIPQGFESLIQTINDKKITANEIKYSDNFSYKGDVDKFNREGNGSYYYKSVTGCNIELNGVWQEDDLVKGSGVITNSEMGDKFDIQSVGESAVKYKLTVYNNGKSIYTEVLDAQLNEIISKTLCDIENTINEQRSKAYHDKYLKDKIFIQQMPINSHPSFKTIGAYMDVASLSLFEFVVFEDSEIMVCKAIYVDTNRLKRQDRGYLTQQDSYASSMAETFNKNIRRKFTIEDDYIVSGESKYRYIASENVLYDEKTKLKLKAVALSEFTQRLKSVANNALLGSVYGTENLSK